MPARDDDSGGKLPASKHSRQPGVHGRDILRLSVEFGGWWVEDEDNTYNSRSRKGVKRKKNKKHWNQMNCFVQARDMQLK